MTREQEKAIKVLEQYKNECIEEYKVELDDKKNIDEQHASYLHQQIEAVYIILNLIQEQEKELKRLDKEAQQYFETTIKQAQTFDSQLQKKDKMIDLILDVFLKRFTAQLVLEYGIENKEQLKQKFKQFYERKVEDEKI